jgi:hypothetical protein
MATYAQLKDGTYSINDLADMHEILDEEEEYRRRFEAAAKARGNR